MTTTYRNRREQIERDFLPRCLKQPTRKVLKEELRCAAMVGACEERDRTLQIIRENAALSDVMKNALIEAIASQAVLDVLGY